MMNSDSKNADRPEPEQAGRPGRQTAPEAMPGESVSARDQRGGPTGTRTFRVAAFVVLAIIVIAGSVGFSWYRRGARVQAALKELPQIDVARLEPGMAELLDEARGAVLAQPASGKAWGKYGSVLLAQDFIPEAAVCYAHAQAFDASESQWPYLRGICLARLEPPAAVPCFQRAAELKQDAALPRLRLVELLVGQGELQRAERYLSEAEQLVGDNPLVMVMRGRLELLQGDFDQALAWTNRACELAPQMRSVHLLLSQIHQRRGNQAAVDEQQQILEKLPDTGAAEGWDDPVLADVAQYKRGTMWLLGITQGLIAQGRNAEAIALLRQAGGLDASDARIVLMLGKAYLRSGNIPAATDAIERARQRDPNQASVHFELGNLALVMRRLDEATKHYREAVRLQPDVVAARYNLALCLRGQGDRDGAISELAETCRQAPQNWLAHRDLGELLLDAGRRDEAIDHLEKAAAIAPADPQIQRLLERARTAAPSGTKPSE